MLHWLFELELEGRVYRWSVGPLVVDGISFRGGLDDLQVESGTATVTITVTDGAIPWVELAQHAQGARATLRRWLVGTAYAAAVVMVSGTVGSVSWDRDDVPVSFDISAQSSAILGNPLPDPLARTGSLTWPLATTASTLGDVGVPYPIVFGYPGYEGAGTYAIMPVPLAQWDATRAETLAVVSEDPDAPITSVLLRNDAVAAEATQDCGRVTDLLGKQVMCADFGAAATGYPASATATRQLFVGFTPSTGGGVARSAYDVISYILRRWGPDTVEWRRIGEVREVLEPYQVDTWIDAGVPDPWSWLEAALLKDLPVAVRIGASGRRFLVPRYWRPSSDRVVASLDVDEHEIAPAGRVTLERPGPTNEFVADFREDRGSVYRARVVATGGDGTDLGAVPTAAPGSASGQSITLVRSGRCIDSRSRYGPLRSPPQEIDWTWDEGTVIRVLEDRIEREAIPAIVAQYALGERIRHDFQENDVIRITDPERGFAGILCVIHEPPLIGSDNTIITVRIPR